MSFSFNFAADADDLDDEFDFGAAEAASDRTAAKSSAAPSKREVPEAPFVELDFEDLLENLPPRISYTSLRVPLDSHSDSNDSQRSITLHRRDLFDARFELLLEADEAVENDVETVRGHDASSTQTSDTRESQGAATDLIPGVYEGGFKTWECALDLVAVLEQRLSTDIGPAASLHGQRIIELGCGTALPSLYLLQSLLTQRRPADSRATKLHLCDYNAQVLRLVTLPNLLLAWYFSDAGERHREALAVVPDAKERPSMLSAPGAGELALTPALVSAFQSDLKDRSIELRLFAGGWKTLDTRERVSGFDSPIEPYDLILTSETIYAPSTVPTLIQILRRLGRPTPALPDNQTDALARTLNSTGLNGTSAEAVVPTPDSASNAVETGGPVPGSHPSTLTLVAAKVLYFGVGGGVEAFRAAVRCWNDKDEVSAPEAAGSAGGWSVFLRRVATGVGRVVLAVGFER